MDRLARFYDLIQPGKIVEFGCGGGRLLEALQASFPDSLLVGLDVSLERICAARGKNLPNVKLIVAQAQDTVFVKNSFNTALFVDVIHEIVSTGGAEAAAKSIKAAHSALKSGGVVIIKDHLRPKPGLLNVTFEDQSLKQRLLCFAERFEGRHIQLEQISEDKFCLDIADAMEFLTKYEDLEDEWEMKEIHFPWSEKDFEEALLRQGFSLIREETHGTRPISLPEGLLCDRQILRKELITAARKVDE